MKFIFKILIIGSLCTACAQQNTKEKKTVFTMNKHITANNIVNEIYKNVKRFDKEPMYFIRPLSNNCVYEILVNDILMLKEYTTDQYATPKNINGAILRSGTQKITVRLYPLGNALKDKYGEGETVDKLLDKTDMQIKVVKYDAYNISKTLDDEKEVLTYNAPSKDGKFIGAGLPYFEYSFTFEAEVPYNLEGWRKGQDLTELDKDKVKSQVVKYYSGIQNILKTKNADAMARLVYGGYLKNAQTRYWTKEDIQQAWDENIEKFKLNITEYGNKGTYDSYQLQFYGDGKLAALKQSSFEPIDWRLRGESGFWFLYEKDESIQGRFTWYRLYLPEGEPLKNLRTID